MAEAAGETATTMEITKVGWGKKKNSNKKHL